MCLLQSRVEKKKYVLNEFYSEKCQNLVGSRKCHNNAVLSMRVCVCVSMVVSVKVSNK